MINIYFLQNLKGHDDKKLIVVSAAKILNGTSLKYTARQYK